MRRIPRMALLVGLTLAVVTTLGLALPPEVPTFTLHQRSRVETEKGSGRFHTVTKTVTWEARKTAVVICDMWDKHWCSGATSRVAEMAPRMNELVTAARSKGALILHCPSETMDFYKNTPQRQLAQAAPKVETTIPLQRWCSLDSTKEAALPIDDSDGGCAEGGKSHRAWSRQIAAIQIAEGDAITDSAEAFYLMKQRGITHVVVMGVHTNMCVLGRPFSIRQMVQQGMNVVLVRDMTDTMYNPARAPYVSHFTGTDLVVDHIEAYWCPSVTSVDFLGGKEFRFKEDRRPQIAIVAAEDEYKTEKTLPEFALKHLGKDFRIRYVFADSKIRHLLPGIEVLQESDVALISVRRRGLPAEQMETVRRFVASGKGLVGIRTASHAFAVRKGDKVPEGIVEWTGFDPEVLGGNYKGHHSEALKTTVRLAPSAAGHPILSGLKGDVFPSTGSLYMTSPLAPGAVPLLIGEAGDKSPEPVAWTYERKGGGRVFYTSLGHVGDFAGEAFPLVLRNGIRWAAGMK